MLCHTPRFYCLRCHAAAIIDADCLMLFATPRLIMRVAADAAALLLMLLMLIMPPCLMFDTPTPPLLILIPLLMPPCDAASGAAAPHAMLAATFDSAF